MELLSIPSISQLHWLRRIAAGRLRGGLEVGLCATEETDCDARNFAQLVLTQISDSHLPPKLNSSNVNMQQQ